MLIQVKTIDEIKEEYIVSFRNNCGNKVTKFLPTSVINGLAYANAKIVQKINKMAAQIEAKLFPEYASGSLLEEIAQREGVPARLQKSKSSVVLLFKAASGTVYTAGTQVKNVSGIIFETKAQLTIGDNGYGYVIAESQTEGEENNVSAYTISIMAMTAPVGHTSVTNPFGAVNGSDLQEDYYYKNLIQNHVNMLSRNTESFYMALLSNFNENILRINARKINSVNNSFELILVKDSAADFTIEEIASLKTQIQDYLPYSDHGTDVITLKNIDWTYFDVYAPIRLKEGYTLENVTRDIQINLSQFIDLRTWVWGGKVEWVEIVEVIKNTEGVLEVIEGDLLPAKDVTVDKNSLPRLRELQVEEVISGSTIGRVQAPILFLNKELPYKTMVID